MDKENETPNATFDVVKPSTKPSDEWSLKVNSKVILA